MHYTSGWGRTHRCRHRGKPSSVGRYRPHCRNPAQAPRTPWRRLWELERTQRANGGAQEWPVTHFPLGST
jgi:hypothetical protein